MLPYFTILSSANFKWAFNYANSVLSPGAGFMRSAIAWGTRSSTTPLLVALLPKSSYRTVSSSRLGHEQQFVDVRIGTVQLRSRLRQRLKRSDPIGVRRMETRQIQTQRRVGRLASRPHIGHAAARQLPLDSNGGDCLPCFGGDSDSQFPVSFFWGWKSPGSSHAGTANSMPKSPASARCSNHWIDNAFLGDAPPRPWPECEISTALAPRGANRRTLSCMMAGLRQAPVRRAGRCRGARD